MKNNIIHIIKNRSSKGFLSWEDEESIHNDFSISYNEIEKLALTQNITALRYKRNQETITQEHQLKLLNSHIAIIGCGGLGGNVAEMLTRIGIGKLTLFDFDIFEEHNLNRQNFSNIDTLGKSKVSVVKEALMKINPALYVDAFNHKFDPEKDLNMLKNVNVVIDALDNPKTKLQLAKMCQEKHIDFIHGAIAGLNGQFTVNSNLKHLYRDGDIGSESSLGNLSCSATFAASIQSSECIKLLLNLGETLKDKTLISNLLENEFIMI